MKFYKPTYTRNEAQAGLRNKFKQAISDWQNLTSDQKMVYNRRCSKLKIAGYNLFIREAMKK